MLRERYVEYQHDGSNFEAYLVYDDRHGKVLPGVFVAHAWGGRDEFVCNRARALAGAGYVGFAADVYGQGVLGSSPEENAGLMGPLLENRLLLQERLSAAFAALCRQEEIDARKTAAIGYCFGGLCVLDMARTGIDTRGVVSFHGMLTPPDGYAVRNIPAKIMVLHGHADPMVPVTAVNQLQEELTAAGADWQIHVYGKAMHGFSNPEANNPDMGIQYNPDAERRSWATTLDFLREILA